MMFLRLSDAGAVIWADSRATTVTFVADLDHFNEGQGNHPD
jgi:hypothetical protein